MASFYFTKWLRCNVFKVYGKSFNFQTMKETVNASAKGEIIRMATTVHTPFTVTYLYMPPSSLKVQSNSDLRNNQFLPQYWTHSNTCVVFDSLAKVSVGHLISISSQMTSWTMRSTDSPLFAIKRGDVRCHLLLELVKFSLASFM